MRELDERLGLTEAAARFVDDRRNPDMVVHPVARLIREAAYARAAGYEDANDCTTLWGDAYFTELVGPTNQNSINPKRHDGLASEASLSRLHNGRALGFERLELAHVDWFLRIVAQNPPEVITLDPDRYDAETYGEQQMALFNTHYGGVMRYPLVVTVAEYGIALAGRLRPGRAWSGADAVPVMRMLLEKLTEHLPNARIRVRADSGFMDPELFELFEEFGVEYAVRLRLNAVLKRYFAERLDLAGQRLLRTRPREKWALYEERLHAAETSWSKKRRIVLKLQYDPAKGELERFVIVTNSRRVKRGVWKFYEHRGQCEQRIDELKNHLRGEKFPSTEFDANQVRLHVVLMAHNLLAAVRVILPEGHQLKTATIERLRVALVKCGATLRRTARRFWIHASRTWPYRELLAEVARLATSGEFVATPIWHAG